MSIHYIVNDIAGKIFHLLGRPKNSAYKTEGTGLSSPNQQLGLGLPVGGRSFWRKRSQNGPKNQKGATVVNRNPLKLLVGTRGFEPLTPTASR